MRTDIVITAKALLDSLSQRGLRLGVAESCTGGLLGAALTANDGASSVFAGGFLVYSNEAKMTLLGVQKSLLQSYGAVSSQIAEAMAVGVLHYLPECDLALSITGVAGQSSESKPKGLVYIGFADKSTIKSQCYNFAGERNEIRHLSVLAAIDFATTA